MEKLILFTLLFLASFVGFGQTATRVKISYITPSENTGMDYSPWLNDNLSSLVASAWGTANSKWVDVKLTLEKRTKLTKVSLYDGAGTFSDNPVTVYALDGTTKTQIGTFAGLTYNQFVDIIVSKPFDADAIIIRKYGNNIPQKVQIYGTAATTTSTVTTPTVTTTPSTSTTTTTPATTPTTVAASRVKISTITPSENTGMDYTPWLNDDLNSLIASAWGTANSKWVDIKLTLEKRTKLTKVSLYDGAGTFSDNPVTVYALDGTTKTQIGTFEGLTYNQFVDIIVSKPFDVDAIIIRKYGNNVPQKVQIYGTAATTTSNVTTTPVVTTPVVTTPVVTTPVAARIKISAIKAGENTGMDYTPWLNDDLNSLIASVWGDNSKWVDIRLTLEKRSKITKISLYDDAGTFTDNPVSIYALNGSKRTLLGVFEGLTYKQFVDIVVATPFDADAIIVHKYGNNIPQKVQVYGLAATTTATEALGDVVPLNNPVVVVTPPTTTTPVATTPVIEGTKIAIDGKRWYQLNNAPNGIGGLFDGVLGVSVEVGWGKIFNRWDAYYPLADDEEMTLKSIRFHDGQGIFTTDPMTLFIITDKWEKIQVAKFTGELYNDWVGPDPADPKNFVLKNPPTAKIRYLLINTYGNFPTEIELYGTHTPSKKVLASAPKKNIKMKYGTGVNGFEWDFYDPFNAVKIDEKKLKAMKSFGGFRHYIDWHRLEASEGNYTFNPTFNGGWNYDAIYQRCKLEGIEVLACIQTAPDWLVNTHPEADRDHNISPAKYGRPVTEPSSYIEQAKVGFQFAARYGSNPNVDRSLLSVYSKPRWTLDNINEVKVGLGVVKYIECGNERDKWWKGRSSYQTAREHAANLSAFYDGHKNTMGPGVGVKNADPNMKVVMAGLAFAKTDYVRGMIDWCKEFRGYNPDGTVNVCWDVINYHLYSDNANSTQSGTSTRGSAPEISNAGQTAKDFVQMSHEYLNDMPVWISELGYDLNQGSPLKAIPIKDKSEYITQADWTLRSSLMYNRLGVERSFFYEVYDDNFANPIQFGSSGLVNPDASRRPAADYLYQTNKLMGDYVYMETISQDPLIDRYELNGKSAYVLMIPDEIGRTATYSLNLGNVSKANLYTPSLGVDSMKVTTLSSVAGKFSLTITETPMFLFPTEVANNVATTVPKTNSIMPTTEMNVKIVEKCTEKEQSLLYSLSTYPNPTIDYLLLSLENESSEQLEVKICDETMGRILYHNVFEKSSNTFTTKLDIRHLPAGSYVVEVIQGGDQITKKIIKVN